VARHPKWTHRQVAEEVGCGEGSVSTYKKIPLLPQEHDRIEEYADYHKERFHLLLGRFNKWIGDTDKPKSPPKKRVGKRIKAAVCNDIHAPFHNEEAFAKFIRQNRDADECWVVGDVLDLFSFSRYEKTSRPFSPVEEFQSGRAVIKTLSEHFPLVRVLHGNHDDRFVKYLVRQNIPADILEFFKVMHPDFLSPLAKICAGYSNVHMMEPKKVDYAKFPFIHQIGDCVLSHAEKYSAITGKATADVIEWLQSYAKTMGIVSDFRFVIQAHTHQATKGWFKFGVVGIEAGCMALTPDYAGNPQLRGGMKPPVIGYTVVYQEDGVTDRNASNFIEL
jgi:UDP-2,3-diacylglucosamine pyrophosphatase LpxH